jgi:antitoxin (DNA-binding transcriptional repressor) of toxin-antitoxin stability system
MTLTVNVHHAKTHLSKLLDPAHAGEEIILAKAENPMPCWAPSRHPRLAAAQDGSSTSM